MIKFNKLSAAEALGRHALAAWVPGSWESTARRATPTGGTPRSKVLRASFAC